MPTEFPRRPLLGSSVNSGNGSPLALSLCAGALTGDHVYKRIVVLISDTYPEDSPWRYNDITSPSLEDERDVQ